ncbi:MULTISPECIES: hypothetical protein [Halorhodospira]|uniref:hypothetical protein n=1 Tax=Halorhodospira TaxID=85108 RepID=UPI001EE89508|nr:MULTISPECIES: hypothetical protein [Halorhodospira]MCG5528588.1 hypothetical protein [Halorhodospira halophila]MCG5543749.1 hypothetical protein [Halorhodospira sp. 9628]
MSKHPELSPHELEECALALRADPADIEVQGLIRRVIGESTQWLSDRERRIGRKERDRHQQKVATAARNLRELLEDGHPSAVGDLWENGLRWCTPLPPDLEPAGVEDLRYLTEQLKRIEDVAARCSMKTDDRNAGGRRREVHRRCVAEISVHGFLSHNLSGTKAQAIRFTEAVHRAAILRLNPDDQSDSDISMRDHVNAVFDRYLALLGK